MCGSNLSTENELQMNYEGMGRCLFVYPVCFSTKSSVQMCIVTKVCSEQEVRSGRGSSSSLPVAMLPNHLPYMRLCLSLTSHPCAL